MSKMWTKRSQFKAFGVVAAALVFAAATSGGATPAAQQKRASIKTAYKTTVLHPQAGVTVTIRYADPNKAEPPADDAPLPITVTIKGGGPSSLGTKTLKGVKGWQPWLFEGATLRDLDGDGVKEVCIRTACHYGGSGGYEYLAVVRFFRAPDVGYRIAELPPVASENIHLGQFYAATYKKGYAVIVTTTPLMDNETRPEPTHWRVSGYILDESDTPTAVWKKTPSKKYTEYAPPEVIQSMLPPGWRLARDIQ